MSASKQGRILSFYFCGETGFAYEVVTAKRDGEEYMRACIAEAYALIVTLVCEFDYSNKKRD